MVKITQFLGCAPKYAVSLQNKANDMDYPILIFKLTNPSLLFLCWELLPAS